MEVKKRAEIITNWINNYCDSASYKPKALIVGISGGIDSSVVSTLCASTGRKTIVLTMPIKQIKSQHDLSLLHAKWLKNKFEKEYKSKIEIKSILSKELIAGMRIRIDDQVRDFSAKSYLSQLQDQLIC